MRGWIVGLVIGLVVGAGGMYLVLTLQWGGRGTTAPVDAAVAVAPIDAGTRKPGKKPRPRRPGAPAQPGEPDDRAELVGIVEETEPVALTGAARALEWRGEAVTLPAQRIDMGGGEARKLEDSEINATVGNQTGGVRDCVVQGATGTDLRATITIQLVVDGTGKVIKSRLQAPHYLFEKGLLGCAQRALGRMRFPATGAPTLVTFPVNLG